MWVCTTCRRLLGADASPCPTDGMAPELDLEPANVELAARDPDLSVCMSAEAVLLGL